MNGHCFNRIITVLVTPVLAVMGLLILLLPLGWRAAVAAPDEAGTTSAVYAQGAAFTLSGTVINEGSQPISDVEVFVWNRNQGSGFLGDTTDSSGAFSVTLQAGDYDVSFNPACGSGYASQTYKGISGSLDLPSSIILTIGHTVSGTVFAADGVTPISNVAIYAFNKDTADGFGLPPTDDNGQYCIGLVTGDYDLGFTPPACLDLGPKTVMTTVNQATSLDVVLPPGFTVVERDENRRAREKWE